MQRRTVVLFLGFLLGLGALHAVAQPGSAGRRDASAATSQANVFGHAPAWRLCDDGGPGGTGWYWMGAGPWAMRRNAEPTESPYDRAQRVAVQRPAAGRMPLPERPTVLERPWTDVPGTPYDRAQQVAAEWLEPPAAREPEAWALPYPEQYQSRVPTPFRPQPSTSPVWPGLFFGDDPWLSWRGMGLRSDLPCASSTWISPGWSRGWTSPSWHRGGVSPGVRGRRW